MGLLRLLMSRKIVVVLMVVFIFILGIFVSGKLDRELFPAMSFDGTHIYVHAGDMSTLDVEQNITKPIERIVLNVEGVNHVNSSSSIGVSTLQVQAEEGQGEEVFKEIETSLKGIESQLPGVTFIQAQQYSTDQPYEFYMTMSNGTVDAMSEFGREILKPRLEALPEVREVGLEGVEKKEVIVELDVNKLQETGISTQQVVQLLQQGNVDTSVATLNGDAAKTTVRWSASLASLDDVQNMELPTSDGFIQLRDIARVYEEKLTTNSVGWNNGTKDFIFVQIGRANNVTQVEMAAAVREEIAQIREEGLVPSFDFEELVAQADYVTEAIDGVSMNVLLGGIIALVVLILFLRNIRAIFIIGLSIPLSILLTFIGMWLLDYSFNMLTLIGLGLGIGMMVDSSIVILESIYRQKEKGHQKLEAVLLGVKEVATAVIASMLTTIVVFVPIGLLGGEMGQFMIVLSLIVVITLVSSVIVAFTLIPTLSENFLKVKNKKRDIQEGVIVSSYGKVVSWITRKKRHRYSLIALFIVVFVSSILLVTKIPMSVMPDVLNRYAELMVELEDGITPEDREAIALEINERLSNIKDVETNLIMNDIDYFYILINMTKGDKVSVEQSVVNEQINSELRAMEENYPVQSVSGADFGGGAALPVVIEIKGESLHQLSEITRDLEKELTSVDGLVGITSSANKTIKEQVISLDEDQMKLDQVSDLQLLSQLQEWSAKIPAGELEGGVDVRPEIFVTSNVSIENKQDLLSLEVPTINGYKELSSYLSLQETEVPINISRRDGDRMVTILADIEGRDLGSVNRDIEELLKNFETPVGYTVSTGGSLQEQTEAMQEMVMILGIAIFLVYVVMAIQFNSFLHPFIVMSVIPLTATGALLGLLVTQSELSILSAMGMVFLIGIVLNNAILLIDRTKQLRTEGLDSKAALIEAGKNRLRPIFMTTLTTCGGMLPLAIATGSASNYQAPLAVVIISGLLFATGITLLLIPSIYLLFEDVKTGIKRLFKRSKKQHMKAA
ncbi:efflux RND transporter permease subunit [Evansella sp. AB-rgal1]|uniref:efflux RND transporter permease subunit n=1 Tax=Evansella sp. AB-rgal1 TaxID=3242696 RepID=UPI00359DCDC2